MKKTLALLLLLWSAIGFSQIRNVARPNIASIKAPEKTEKAYTISWNGIRKFGYAGEAPIQYLHFDGAVYDTEHLIPNFRIVKPLPISSTDFTVELKNAKYTELGEKESGFLLANTEVGTSVSINKSIGHNRGKKQAVVTIFPFRENSASGKTEYLRAFDLKVTPLNNPSKKAPAANRAFTANSVLATGTWHKIAVAKDGVYKLDYNFLKNLGIDMATLDPRNIRIYGNGGGMLPFDNSEYRHDDLKENAIYVEGEADAVFNVSDYVLFYGQGPDEWEAVGTKFNFTKNLYSDSTCYFITTDLGLGKRIPQQPSEASPVTTINTFSDFAAHEADNVNLIKTGRRWFGEEFNSIKSTHNFVFSFPNISNSQATIDVAVAAHCVGCSKPSNYLSTVVKNQSQPIKIELDDVQNGYTKTYAIIGASSTNFAPNNSTFNIEVKYSQPTSDAKAWLDYLVANVRRNLSMAGDQMHFRDLGSIGSGVATYELASATNCTIWETTDPTDVKEQQFTLSGSLASFNASTDSLRTFISFKDQNFLVPTPTGLVENQNLHGLPQADMLIVTPPVFLEQANELAEFHRDQDNLTVNVALTGQIYNEYSSGAQDITAIKDFTKMFYDRANGDEEEMPDYLLLFGDASYDYKDRIKGNTNFIPSYQSLNSTAPLGSYIWDDYMGLLDDNESDDTDSDFVDIGIGRLPVKNSTQAQIAISKIKQYYSASSFGKWRNWSAFIGDDFDSEAEGGGDQNHMLDADKVANHAQPILPNLNQEKIYLDAYKQESTPGGNFYPDAKADLLSRLKKGALMVTYFGHGGELGWAHERVLEVPDINSLSNAEKLPVFLTSTCEFSRYDDPQRTAAGEYVFLNPQGGGIALFTTSRIVYADVGISQELHTHLDLLKQSGVVRLGDVHQAVKASDISNQLHKYVLLGDPALKLAFPEHEVKTTHINGNVVSASDTIKALEKVTIKGMVTDTNGNKLTDFNGIVYPTVFDKEREIETQNNDGEGTFKYTSRESLIFNGKASVKGGDFEFTFVVPKDISYKYGNGRISYYAENGTTDANGYYEGFTVGGSDENAAADNQGPDVDLFMNDENFAFGGLTNENPDLYGVVFDENGINTVGSGIGHDIVAVLDENTGSSINLNDFYESDLDSYQSGSVRYPFNKLAEGKHTLRLKVWDTHNNSGEGYTEFVVAESAQLALDHVLNYPNPFTTNTSFYFEHNRPGENLDVSIQIFTVSGKVVKSIDTYASTDSFRVGPIQWDGMDEYGDRIGRGVYVYKVKVSAPTGESVDHFEKLVILN